MYDEKVAERGLNKGMSNFFNRIFGNDERIEELIASMNEKQNDIVEIKTSLKCEIKRLDEKITGLITFFGIALTIITILTSVHLNDIDKRFDYLDEKIDIQTLSLQKQIDTMHDDIKEIKEILKKKK